MIVLSQAKFKDEAYEYVGFVEDGAGKPTRVKFLKVQFAISRRPGDSRYSMATGGRAGF